MLSKLSTDPEDSLMLYNKENIKLNILHLIIFHNIDITEILVILLILYNGFDKTNLEQLLYSHCYVGSEGKNPYKIYYVFLHLNSYFINVMRNAIFDKYNLNFNNDYETLLMNQYDLNLID
jgi:hypothetical protein